MSLVMLLITVAVMGMLVWALTSIVPMPAPFKNAIIVIAVVVLVLYVLQSFGLLPNLGIRIVK